MNPTDELPVTLEGLKKLKDELSAIVRPFMKDAKAVQSDTIKTVLMQHISPKYLKLKEVKRKIAEIEPVKKAAAVPGLKAKEAATNSDDKAKTAATDYDLGGAPPVETAGSNKPDEHATTDTAKVSQDSSPAADTPANSQINGAADATFDAPPGAQDCSDQTRHSLYVRFIEGNSILEVQGDHVLVMNFVQRAFSS